MDCRSFHKNLEEYLEDGLDFAGRFGMERHADQCISCGKDLTGARKLRSMVREMGRVRAPQDFETSVLNQIKKSKGTCRFSGIRRFWAFGCEWPSTRRLVLASSGLAVVAVGVFLLSELTAVSTPPPVVQIPVQKPAEKIIEEKGDLNPAVVLHTPEVKNDLPAKPEKAPEVAEVQRASVTAEKTQVSVMPEPEQVADRQVSDRDPAETDYVEYQMIGPDNRPVTFRVPLPVRTRIHSGQTHEEYYIRNVSH